MLPGLMHVRPPVKVEAQDRGRNQEVSSIGSGPKWYESEPSGEGVETVTSEADDTERENIPLISRRAASTTLSTGSSVHSSFFCDPQGRVRSGEGPVDAPATSYSVSYGPDQPFIYLPSTSPNRNVRLSLKDVRVMKRYT